MRAHNAINYDELIERGRKLQSEAVFEAIRRSLVLMKSCFSKKPAGSSPGRRLASPTGQTLA